MNKNTKMKSMLKYSLFLLLITPLVTNAQKLPDEMRLSPDGRKLITGGNADKGLYDESVIRDVHLTFPQSNWWQLLKDNYESETEIPATMVVDGVTYDSVGVRFRGNTSYQAVPNSDKKPFAISLDFVHEDQKLMGYKTLRMPNCHEDESFMREMFYLHQIRKYVPAAKAAYVNLYLNDQSWGVYPNVQQLNKDFFKEWFFSKDGSSWRADVETTGGGPGGGGWGDGTAGLNYLGADTALFKKYYTLKFTERNEPWKDLLEACYTLNKVPVASLPDSLPSKFDVDRTLWFLASEILFSDEDSYVYKGKMDYYIYWEAETGRLTPIEYDGNSVMSNTNAQNWSPFYNETKVNYPLMNKIFAVPEYRQRYLAHLRTMINEAYDTASANAIIENFRSMIDSLVQKDPKKLYTYTQFQSEVTFLKNFIANRKKYLLTNSEVNQTAPVLSEVAHYSDATAWKNPQENQQVIVKAKGQHTSGILRMNLYYSDQLTGNFIKLAMTDDGQNGDDTAGDGIYAAPIPGFKGSTWVRYYVEAIADNTAKTAQYEPAGAEHDVYVYNVLTGSSADTSVVINELMASNTATVTDDSGKYEDWIELFNKSDKDVDLSGYYLTDDASDLQKWTFPAGSVIAAHDYYILWADEDLDEGDNHCDFKLSASGEQLILSDPSGNVADSVTWGQQETDMGLARVPNGTGNFIIQKPTFKANNESLVKTNDPSSDVQWVIYPNPAKDYFKVRLPELASGYIEVYNTLGAMIHKSLISSVNVQINTQTWPSGLYFVKYNQAVARILISD